MKQNTKNTVVQANIPAVQQYHRDLTKCRPLKAPTITWMCPKCDNIHPDVPQYLAHFMQCQCGWFGIEEDVVLARDPQDY